MNKKILIISAVFPPEPIVSAKLSYDLALEISKTKPVVVISPKPTRPYGFKFENAEISEGFEHYRLESYTCPGSKMIGRLRETYSFGKACYQFISENHDSIDEIYANTWPLLAQYYAVKAAKKFHIPITIHVQDIYPESLSNKIPLLGGLVYSILKPIDNFIFKESSNIIVISNKTKEYLSQTRKNSAYKISVVPNWQNEKNFIDINKYTKPQNQKFTFMYLGNIGPVAGLELLIDAFKDAQMTNCKLVIAGAGSMKENLIKYSVSKQDIEFWDVPEGDVPKIQSFADVMLLPMKKGSASSSIPSKLPAYMFSKKPIIACVDLTSDTADVINNSNCGWVLNPEDKNALVKVMQMVSQKFDSELYIKGNNGFQYAITNFSKHHNLQKLIKILN